jgi:hypothetical protein
LGIFASFASVASKGTVSTVIGIRIRIFAGYGF